MFSHKGTAAKTPVFYHGDSVSSRNLGDVTAPENPPMTDFAKCLMIIDEQIEKRDYPEALRILNRIYTFMLLEQQPLVATRNDDFVLSVLKQKQEIILSLYNGECRNTLLQQSESTVRSSPGKK